MTTGLLIERDVRENGRTDQKLVVTKLPKLPRKNGSGYDNPGSDYDQCYIPPIQFDYKRGIMRTLLGLDVRAGQRNISYVEGNDNVGRILGIYRNSYKGSVTIVYRPSDGSAVEAKEFESLGIRFRVRYTEEKI